MADYLKISDFNDIAPNGLQVEGQKEIKKIVTAVSASVELFNLAIQTNADTILVHHGIIWDFERPVYKGGYRERVKLLLENNINLFAYHLPLDAHPDIGNNAQLAIKLGLQNIQPFGDFRGQYIGIKGNIPAINKDTFFNNIESVVQRKPLLFPFGPEVINSVGIVSGAAQKDIHQAVAQYLDAFITGEVSERILHYAKEEKIHFISAGHYATERFGILALGQLLQNKFKLEVQFIDIPNPV